MEGVEKIRKLYRSDSICHFGVIKFKLSLRIRIVIIWGIGDDILYRTPQNMAQVIQRVCRDTRIFLNSIYRIRIDTIFVNEMINGNILFFQSIPKRFIGNHRAVSSNIIVWRCDRNEYR